MRIVQAMRPTKPQIFMEIASTWAKLSTCSARVAVGAVIVNSFGQIISSGYNGSPRGFPHCNEIGCDFDDHGHCRRTIHAEVNAIIQCARVGVSCDDCVIYVTHSPCPACSHIIIQSGISKVIYKEVYGNIASTEYIFSQSNVNLERE